MSRKKGYKHTEETKKKIGLIHKGKKVFLETRKRMSETRKRLFREGKLKSYSYWKGKRLSEKHKKKISLTLKNKVNLKVRLRNLIDNPSKKLENRKKASERTKKLWQNKEWKEKTIKSQRKSMKLKPTKPEQTLINLIQKHNFPFAYCGNGKVIIEGLNPDFIDNDGSKRIIEVFGDYWHNLPKAKERDKRRLETYAKYGFKTLIIWEHELQNKQKVLERIRGW